MHANGRWIGRHRDQLRNSPEPDDAQLSKLQLLTRPLRPSAYMTTAARLSMRITYWVAGVRSDSFLTGGILPAWTITA